jgi:hypothetical protein
VRLFGTQDAPRIPTADPQLTSTSRQLSRRAHLRARWLEPKPQVGTRKPRLAEETWSAKLPAAPSREGALRSSAEVCLTYRR